MRKVNSSQKLSKGFCSKEKYLSTAILLIVDVPSTKDSNSVTKVHMCTRKNRTPLQLQRKKESARCGSSEASPTKKKAQFAPESCVKARKHFPPIPHNENDGRSSGDKKKTLHVILFTRRENCRSIWVQLAWMQEDHRQ